MKNQDIVIKARNADGNFTSVAGMRSRRFMINGDAVDPAAALAFLNKAPIKRASISGRGLFKDAAADSFMRQTFFDGAVKDFQLSIPDIGAIEGPFQITNLEFSGEHNGEVTYEFALESAGVVEPSETAHVSDHQS